MTANGSELSAHEPRQFATTRWSLILSAAHSQNGDQKARAALEELCRTYWRPIFSFVCRRGGLSASTTYHFRIVATNNAGTSYGGDRTFTALSATGPPVVVTNPATSVASSSATLNGAVDPHGLTTSVHFQYGTTTSYGLTTGAQSHTGNTYLNISANISGLSASTTYHFRIVATNSAGTSYGGDREFTTP